MKSYVAYIHHKVVAGIGVTAGSLSADIYTSIIIMVALATSITPIWLKKAYSQRKGLPSATPT